MYLPEKEYSGKVLGGLLGFCIAGLWGGVIGVIIGHIHDRQVDNGEDPWFGLWSSYGSVSANTEQSAFTMGVIVLSAKMARTDGRITRVEVDAFKRVFHIGTAQEYAVGRMFDKARKNSEGFEPYALQLAQVFRRKPAVLEEILGGLFIIAAADAELSADEIVFLKRVSFIFGFGDADFSRIAARSGVRLPHGEKAHRPEAEAFAILGIEENATAEETKHAYHALIREHHPDKLMAQGMPPEFVATATEKMKRINVAYETVCKIQASK